MHSILVLSACTLFALPAAVDEELDDDVGRERDRVVIGDDLVIQADERVRDAIGEDAEARLKQLLGAG